MKKEEAIKWVDALSLYLSICNDQSLKDSLSSDIEKTIKALDMVIEVVKRRNGFRVVRGYQVIVAII